MHKLFFGLLFGFEHPFHKIDHICEWLGERVGEGWLGAGETFGGLRVGGAGGEVLVLQEKQGHE